MPLYRIESDLRVKQLKPSPFRKERNILKLFEANLDSLLGVRYMASEFTIITKYDVISFNHHE